VRFRSSTFLYLVVLSAIAGILASLITSYGPGAWFESPVSPVAPPSPLAPVPFFAATPPQVQSSGPFAAPFWSSPLPWVGIGVVLFGNLALALNALLRRILRNTE
jgi:hypothetical protein